MITPENLVSHEIIGLNAEIIESSNKQIFGTSGKVIDETKSMFILSTENGIKKIPKKHSKWKFTLGDKTVTLSGDLLQKRPHERLEVKL